MKKRIDFERVKSQELKLNAIDRGGRIGSATIHVIIDDENDNDPVFTKDKYRIQITESTPIGEVGKYWFGVYLDITMRINHLLSIHHFVCTDSQFNIILTLAPRAVL